MISLRASHKIVSALLWSGLLLLAGVGPSRVNAAESFAGVPVALQPFVERGEIAGAVSLVADRERVLHLSAVGRSRLDADRPLKTDDLFWIASMSKPVTAVAVALLVDDGKLSFDDPVEKFLPEFRSLWVVDPQSTDTRRVLAKARRPITLRDVLTHTSGLGEYRVTDPHWTLAAMAKTLAREPLAFQPGERWLYSTAGTDLLGRVVEVASGLPFDVFLQQRLFNPLGMRDTTFWISPEQAPRLAQTYRPAADMGKLEPIAIAYLYGGAVDDRARPPLGGAGLFSTAEDITKFYQMMLNRGEANGRRLLTPGTVAELTRSQTGDLVTRPGMPWGLGFCVIEDPSKMTANHHLSPGTFGHGGAHGTSSWADPERDLIYVFMIQRDALKPTPDDSAMRRAYQDAVAAALGAR